jgi:hypothetical protein
MQLPVEPIDGRGQDSQEALPVLVIEVDCLPASPREAIWYRAPRNSMRRDLAIYLTRLRLRPTRCKKAPVVPRNGVYWKHPQ